MNYRLDYVFSYERFENALICILSIGAFDRVEADFKLSYFSQKRSFAELLSIVFENNLPKGVFW